VTLAGVAVFHHGYGQINTDVPIENAEAMLTLFSRLTYPAAGKAPAR